MYCTRSVTPDIVWVGGNDRRLSMFEGVYAVPAGVSYNAYLLRDEKTVLFDTVDKAVARTFFDNVEHTLGGRPLDYVVVHHMEPDHSATLDELLKRHPEAKLVCNKMTLAMTAQFFGEDLSLRALIVGEGDKLSVGRHELSFFMAPMVHWPEVMVTYDSRDRVLFSADAFGVFGAINGALFADEVDFYGDYLPEARRYYCNIVGKYGAQTQALLKKMAALDVSFICPLHGFVHRRDFEKYVTYYDKWSSYEPEERGVLIAYASIYGNTANAAEALSCKLRELGVTTAMYDASVTSASEIVAAAFRFSHLVFASPTYNAGVFITMEELLRDIAAHNLQKRMVAFIENGSWAPASARLMRAILEPLKGTTFLEGTVTIKSALKKEQEAELYNLAAVIADSVAGKTPKQAEEAPAAKKKFRCKICGYVHEADELPADFKCPVCGRGAEFFEEIT
ncbi:MAG TPA: MBL fold metallo-hydrolase [Clostridia bacterium]|nr:MBL fold metallo-hydrolase [Clostridia bacterium]